MLTCLLAYKMALVLALTNLGIILSLMLVKVLSRHRNYHALVNFVNILLMLCSTTGVWFKISVVTIFVILPNYHD